MHPDVRALLAWVDLLTRFCCLFVCWLPFPSFNFSTQLNSLYLFLCSVQAEYLTSKGLLLFFALTRPSAERQGLTQQTRIEAPICNPPVQIEPICTSACPASFFSLVARRLAAYTLWAHHTLLQSPIRWPFSSSHL